MRSSWSLRAIARADASSSARPTPTSASSPCPISPTTVPSTVTAAVLTLLATARTRRFSQAVATHPGTAAGVPAEWAAAYRPSHEPVVSTDCRRLPPCRPAADGGRGGAHGRVGAPTASGGSHHDRARRRRPPGAVSPWGSGHGGRDAVHRLSAARAGRRRRHRCRRRDLHELLSPGPPADL